MPPIVNKIIDVIINPLIGLLMGGAVIYFMWGVIQKYIMKADSDDKSEGTNHILWGIVGLFIMVSVYGILAIIKRTLGLPV